MRFQGEVQQGQGMQEMLDRMQKEYASVSETCRQLERANAAMELQLERAKAQVLLCVLGAGVRALRVNERHTLDPLNACC